MTFAAISARTFASPEPLPVGGPVLWLIVELRRRRRRAAAARRAA